MGTPTTPTLQELRDIQRKLDASELQHLREHAAALSLLLESTQGHVQRLEAEPKHAVHCSKLWARTALNAQDALAAKVAPGPDRQVGVLQSFPTTQVATISAYELAQFCTHSSMAAGSYFPFEQPVSGLDVQLNAANDPFKRGVLVCLADVLSFIRSKTGAKTLDDLLLEPTGQDVERPGSGGPQ